MSQFSFKKYYVECFYFVELVKYIYFSALCSWVKVYAVLSILGYINSFYSPALLENIFLLLFLDMRLSKKEKEKKNLVKKNL